MKSQKNCLDVAVPEAPDGCTRYAICKHELLYVRRSLPIFQTSIGTVFTVTVLWICLHFVNAHRGLELRFAMHSPPAPSNNGIVDIRRDSTD